jgi:LmbE family N-acetylglucosaminyl deacetylase
VPLPERLVVLSPHCDDGVFACGRLIAGHPGTLVVTVFAGAPPPAAGLTEWDRASGFEPGDDVMALRRGEDARALALLGARPRWLDFLDDQYGAPAPVDAIADAIEGVLDAETAEAVVVPLGLFHHDHRVVHEAALAVLARRAAGTVWLAYEDALYRRFAGLLDQRLDGLREAGFPVEATALVLDGDATGKRRAVECYASQLRALTTPGRPGYADVFEAERYWKLAG